MPKPSFTKPKQKKAVNGQCVYMDLNGKKIEEPSALANNQPHIIPFKPKK